MKYKRPVPHAATFSVGRHRVIRKTLTGFGTVLTLLLSFLAALIYFSIQWMFNTWANLSMDELVYHLTAPLDGTNTDMIWDYMSQCLAPAVMLLIALIFVYLGLRGKRGYYLLMLLLIVVPCLEAKAQISSAWETLDGASYVKSKGTKSTFVEDYYVSPADVALEFPEQPRNLIYIYLESMETTYADKESGGGFDENVIPELTALAQENEDFSGTDTSLNGGHALTGATWTMGAMFAQTSGLPLEISIDGNDMDTQDSFFSGAITLGDILEQAGYSQTLMIGSDATFGGRRLYFTEHGNYDILDYNYAVQNGWLPEDYYVFWGYEDEKLFANAKDRLLELASQDTPFNFTMLTVDTHFEDGYLCELCPDTFGDNQYANVMACSSAQVAEFVSWIKQQDFYENTTIVISGDHPTMDSDFCEDVDPDYERKTYTCYINAAAEPASSQKRTFSTFDNFPTTLAAMGVKIEGDRLALGTNLFSDRPTLTEEVGLENENRELEKKSIFLKKLADIDENSTALLQRQGIPTAELTVGDYDSSIGAFSVAIANITNISEISSVRLAVWKAEDQSDLVWYELSPGEDGIYRLNVDLTSFGFQTGEYQMHAYVTDTSGMDYLVGETIGVVN